MFKIKFVLIYLYIYRFIYRLTVSYLLALITHKSMFFEIMPYRIKYYKNEDLHLSITFAPVPQSPIFENNCSEIIRTVRINVLSVQLINCLLFSRQQLSIENLLKIPKVVHHMAPVSTSLTYHHIKIAKPNQTLYFSKCINNSLFA